MISNARKFMRQAPTYSLFPGIAIMLVVLSFNTLGDGLRDALDPKLKIYKGDNGRQYIN